jgi:nucleotide-binding universal stress UspA family protein
MFRTFTRTQFFSPNAGSRISGKPIAKPGETLMFELILVPVTDDACSQRSVQHAQDMARLLGSKLTFVHVLTESGPTELEAKALLGQLALGARYVPTLKVVNDNDQSVASRILEVANDVKADLIVIGTHGREGFDKLLHGSVAQSVAGSADIPVQIVPLHERSSDRFADR